LIIAEAGKNRILKLGAAGAVTVLAGAGPAGLSGDNGPASAAQLNNPNDVAIDSAGNILIADAGNNRIRKLTAAQIAADITAPPPTSPAATTPVAVTVVNAASLLPGPVAPNEIITVFGSGFDPAHTQVMFDNVSASLFYAGAMQLNVLAPASLRPNSSVVLNVLANGVVVGTATVNTTSASPAIFTTKGGIGPAAALNQDSSVNSDIDPAPRGNIVSLFLTGDGQVAGRASATIGGYDCDVFYAGPAPGFPGLMQVNIRVPGGFLSPGDQPVLVTLNGVSTQPGVTLAIR
jgi:uncharacterized protein (TIGR03437 family)